MGREGRIRERGGNGKGEQEVEWRVEGKNVGRIREKREEMRRENR